MRFKFWLISFDVSEEFFYAFIISRLTKREIQNFLEIKIKTEKEKINLEELKHICNKKLTENGNNIA